MGEIREWKVRSNSFRSDYLIRGDTLSAAIKAEFRRICQDALPRTGNWRPVEARGEWRAGILGGVGGVELVIKATSGGGSASDHPTWIEARPADLPDPISLVPQKAALI